MIHATIPSRFCTLHEIINNILVCLVFEDAELLLCRLVCATIPRLALLIRNPLFQVPTSPNYPTERFMQQSLFPAPLSNTVVVHQQASIGFPERPGKAECAYFMKTGDCKFGSTCIYHHPRSRLMMSPSYNVTPGKTVCAYFMKTGDCKFGSACMFYHPSSPTYNVSPHGLPSRPVSTQTIVFVCSVYILLQ